MNDVTMYDASTLLYQARSISCVFIGILQGTPVFHQMTLKTAFVTRNHHDDDSA